MDKRLKILFLTPRLPFPVIGGDRLKPYNILKYLGQKHDVTLLSLYQGLNDPKNYIEELKKLNIRVDYIQIDPVKSAIRAGLVSISSNYPLEIAYYNQLEFASKVLKYTKKINFDLGISFFMRTAEYLKDLPLKKILMAEDCRTIYQKRSYEESTSLKQKIVRKWEYNKLLKYEPSIVNFFDSVTLVTTEDIESMKIANSDANYRLLTNGTDIDKFKPGNDFEKRDGILFVGKLDIWANVLMLQKIVNQLLPEIKLSVPDVKFKIVGANPPKEVKKLVSKDVDLITNVPETLPYLQNSRVFLHPHTGGSGIQNKLLEAMASGCPVVTSVTGNQGIHAKNREEVLIANNDTEFIKSTIELLTNNNLANNISKNARKLIEETHSWQVVNNQMDDIINELFT